MMHADDVRFDRRGRKGRSVAKKLSIVQLTMEPWNSCARIVRTHGVNANQSFKWRRLFDRGAAERSESEIDGLAASHDYYRTSNTPVPVLAPGDDKTRTVRLGHMCAMIGLHSYRTLLPSGLLIGGSRGENH